MYFDKGKQSEDEYRAGRISVNGEVFDQLCDIFFRYDPVGIGYFDNIDEYEPEAETILPRLETTKSIEDVKIIIYEEFMRWFNDGEPSEEFGSKEIYDKISEEVWALIKNT